jgi:multidrug efflux system membrane fusion protein
LSEIQRYFGQGGHLPVTVQAQDGSGQVERGELTFIDNSVDTTTGTIRLKGTFQNTDRAMWPGQFLNVTLGLTTRRNSIVVPNQAVQTGQEGTFVYIVKPDQTVEFRPVAVGPRSGLDLVIEQGLRAGEIVVTEGQLRLQPGSTVQVRGAGGPDEAPGGRGGNSASQDGSAPGPSGGGFAKDGKRKGGGTGAPAKGSYLPSGN